MDEILGTGSLLTREVEHGMRMRALHYLHGSGTTRPCAGLTIAPDKRTSTKMPSRIREIIEMMKTVDRVLPIAIITHHVLPLVALVALLARG